MECERALALIEAGEQDALVAAHLEQCPECRAEAAFARRVAAAVAAMPRVPAPEGLLERVMAEVRAPEAARPVGRRRPLALAPWEIGWVAALCLLLLAFLPPSVVSSQWPVISVARAQWASLMGAAGRLLTSLQASGAEQDSLGGLWRMLGQPGGGWSGALWMWVPGAAAFALALYLLLSWRAGDRSVWEVEDASGQAT